MRICVSVGHSILRNGSCTSSTGIINEYSYCKVLAPYVKKALEKDGHIVDVVICPERVFESQLEEQSYKIPRINKIEYDLVMELHLNNYNTKAKGTTVLYKSKKGREFAEKIQESLSSAFINRETTQKKNLYMLNKTKAPAVLLEMFFDDNKIDCNTAKNLGLTGMANLIAKALRPNKEIPKSSIKSIVDYMKSINLDSSYDNRRKLAKRYGIANYTGTAKQNVILLDKIRTL